ncbi:MAG: galactose-1-epimerase [Verrucomicrobia bacterium]|jgi:aldose 1-epimerase|nr:galactose-1-epimerase [Verrucomicrobiota bacterium]
MKTTIHQEPIGEMSDGRVITAFTLSNEGGLRATFLNFGGVLIELEVPDRIGMPDDIVLGLDAIDDYVQRNSNYFGTLVGRFANRIAGGSFTLDGKKYQLPVNEEAAGVHLHGGPRGFSHQLFEGTVIDRDGDEALLLRYESPDGEMGYPGNLELRVTLSLTADNGLRYEYEASTDAPTVINLTAHPYFNLAGQDAGTIREHVLQIRADHYLPTDPETNTPKGKQEPVDDSPFDFRQADSLDHRLDSPDPQVAGNNGFDHTFVFPAERDLSEPVASVEDPASGRCMTVYTSEPGVQLYTGNNLDGSFAGKGGCYYARHAGLCLETQHFPNAPNEPDFPSTRLDPGKPYKSFTEYRFSAT